MYTLWSGGRNGGTYREMFQAGGQVTITIQQIGAVAPSLQCATEITQITCDQFEIFPGQWATSCFLRDLCFILFAAVWGRTRQNWLGQSFVRVRVLLFSSLHGRSFAQAGQLWWPRVGHPGSQVAAKLGCKFLASTVQTWAQEGQVKCLCHLSQSSSPDYSSLQSTTSGTTFFPTLFQAITWIFQG